MAEPWKQFEGVPNRDAPDVAGKPWLQFEGTENKDPPPSVPGGYSSTDPNRTEKDFWGDVQDDVIAKHPVAGRVAKALQGVPLIGQYADNVVEAFGHPEAATAMRVNNEAFQDRKPVESAALQVGGAVASAPLIAGLAPFTLPGLGATSLAGRGAAALGYGGIAGGIEGLISGYGREGDRAGNALADAKWGAGAGAVMGPVAVGAGAGIKAVGERVSGSAGKVADAFGLSKDAGRVMRQAVGDAPTRPISPNGMAMEASPRLAQYADAAASKGGRAGEIIGDAVADRVDTAGAAARTGLNDAFGEPAGRFDLAAKLRAGTKAARKEAYDAAYAWPIDYAGPRGRAVEAALAKAPPRYLKPAIDRANDLMRMDDIPQQIMASVSDAGEITYKEMPNAVQLDYIKRALDQAGRATDKAGKQTPEAVLAASAAKMVRNAHAGANPKYREALRTGMNSIQTDEAVEAGANAFKVTPEVFSRSLRGLNGTQRDAFKLGMRQSIEDTLGNVKAVMSDPNMESREALRLVKEFSTGNNRAKITRILGKDEAAKLFDQMDEATTAFGIRAALNANSKTNIRGELQGAVESISAPGALGELFRGNVGDASKRLVQIFSGNTPDAIAAREAGIYEELARALTEKRGPQAEAALGLVQKAIAGEALSAAKSGALARYLVTSFGAGGYQAATQAQQAISP